MIPSLTMTMHEPSRFRYTTEIVQQNRILASALSTFDAREARNLVIGASFRARRKGHVRTASPGADSKIDRIGDLLVLMVGGNYEVSDCSFAPLSFNGIERGSKPHVAIWFEKRAAKFQNGVAIMFIGGIERYVKQTSGTAKALVMLAKLDDSEFAIRVPITFEYLRRR